MHRAASFAIAILLSLTIIGYPQDKASMRTAPAREKLSNSPGEDETTALAPQISDLVDDAQFTLSKQVDEVSLILSITDSRGRFVNNLTADDLKLLDNRKAPSKWNYFKAQTDLPLHVILAIDVSSSVFGRLPFEQKAASAFLKNVLRKDIDDAAVVAFGSTVLEKTPGMTNDVNALNSEIHTLRADGDTALYDAIVLSSHILREHKGGSLVRPIIILISDGVDTSSKSKLKAAEEAATRVGAPIYALDSTSIYETDRKGRLILEKLTRETGGFVLSAHQNSDLNDAFKMIKKILRCQYSVGYIPSELEADGGFRSIEVIPNKRSLHVHTRAGYYAPSK
jgi:Ca-activated chloride channel family protein